MKISNNEIKEIEAKWKNTVVGIIPDIVHLKVVMLRLWTPRSNMYFFSCMRMDFFSFKFYDKVDFDKII